MDRFEVFFQTILGLIALSTMNRLLFHDSLVVSVGSAAATVAAFWLGRLAVKLLRRRNILRRQTSD